MTVYTEEDLRELLQIGARQARALVRTDGFPAFKIGRSYRVEESALLDWIHTNPEIKLDYTKI
jgi:excisionase family DNA binding protein